MCIPIGNLTCAFSREQPVRTFSPDSPVDAPNTRSFICTKLLAFASMYRLLATIFLRRKPSARRREAMVNRLLRERDARLATRNANDEAGRSRNEVAVAAAECDPNEATRPTRRDLVSGGIVGGIEDERHLFAMNELGNDGGGGGGGGRSPGSIKDDLFFASDLVHPHGSNDYTAVDPRVVGAPSAEETFLLRLRDGDAHADHLCDDMSGRSSNAHEVSSERLRPERDSAASIRPLQLPPSPPLLGPNGRPSPGQTKQGVSFGHDARNEGATFSPRGDSPGSCATARRTGQSTLQDVPQNCLTSCKARSDAHSCTMVEVVTRTPVGSVFVMPKRLLERAAIDSSRRRTPPCYFRCRC